MKKVIPHTTTKEAMAALDNGGRFYNWSSKAGDGHISSAELKKAAGVISGAQNSILYLEMTLANFESDEKNRVISFLSRDLKPKYDKYKPAHLSAVDPSQPLEAGSSAIFTGVPKLVESKTEFSGFIMVPVYTGKTMTFTMVPIIEAYDVYQLHQQSKGHQILIGHDKSSKKLPERLTRIGGVLKDVSTSDKGSDGKSKLLEITHYTPLDE